MKSTFFCLFLSYQVLYASPFLNFVEGTLSELSYIGYDLSGNRSADLQREMLIARRQAYYGKTYRPRNHRLNADDKDFIEAYSADSLNYINELRKSKMEPQRDSLGALNSSDLTNPDQFLVSAYGSLFTGREANRLKFDLIHKSFLFFLSRQSAVNDSLFPLMEIKNNAAISKKLLIAGYLATINELAKNESTSDAQVQKTVHELSGEKKALAVHDLQRVKAISKVQQVLLNNIWSLQASDPLFITGQEMLKAGYFILEDKFLKLADSGADVREVIRLAEIEAQKNRSHEAGSHFFWKSKTEPYRYLQDSCRKAVTK